jgi:hypothetical protein
MLTDDNIKSADVEALIGEVETAAAVLRRPPPRRVRRSIRHLDTSRALRNVCLGRRADGLTGRCAGGR